MVTLPRIQLAWHPRTFWCCVLRGRWSIVPGSAFRRWQLLCLPKWHLKDIDSGPLHQSSNFMKLLTGNGTHMLASVALVFVFSLRP